MHIFIRIVFFSLLSIQVCHAQRRDSLCIRIKNGSTDSAVLCRTDLLRMPQDTVAWKDHDGKEHIYLGVALDEILKKSGVAMGDALKGKKMRQYVLVKCADGYQVLFSVAELDENFSNHHGLLACQMDGQPLPPGKGPYRLIVAGDKRAARSAFSVREIVIGSPPE